MRYQAAVVALGLGLLWAGVSAEAQEGPRNVRVIARVDGKDEAAVVPQAGDVKVQWNGRGVPVTRVQPLLGKAGQPVEVAVLIDDGLRGNFGNQLKDVEDFVRSTASPQAAVAIGYMRNGRAVFTEKFSTDPEVAVKAVRLPISSGGISGSPYFCLQDLVKHWPSDTGAPHVVLMITNGIDLYNGSVSPVNQYSTYVKSAIQDAQRMNTPVYSIYFGRFDVSGGAGSFSGQSYLGEVADGTGGRLYNQGQINPVSISPYFKKFQKDLAESYLLTFQVGSRKMQRLKVSLVNGGKMKAQVLAGSER